MLTAGDLEVNVLEFRQRSFQYQRSASVAAREIALFSRTETETESRFRPKLIHLVLLVPQEWVVLDEPNDVLLVARDGTTPPVRTSEQVVEVGAERVEFDEQGIRWKRVDAPSGAFVYAPTELAGSLLTPSAYRALGIG
ncbi:MAG: hypothetical protein ACREEC_09845 [Thermoplasmata archaeon]